MSRVPDERINLPACKCCHDWMFPSLLWVHPVDAVVWVCMNGCGAIVLGHTPEPLEEDELDVLIGMGVWAAAQKADE